MDRKLSDEQLDRIAKNLLNDFALSDETIDEIADSPKLRWNVRNKIEAEKSRREKSWFSAFRPQILAFGALAIVFCLGLISLYLTSKDANPTIARENSVQNPNNETVKTAEDLAPIPSKTDSEKTETPNNLTSNSDSKEIPAKNIETKTKFVAKAQTAENPTKQSIKASKKQISPKTVKEETKTDFIALSYAPTTDSGQIVRVKVPGSMMVSLGVTTNVETEFVSAEVVIGDDGLARAIRFIR